jgi:hypothetical protein
MNKHTYISLFIATLVCANSAMAAEPKHTSTMYKWYDEQGNVQYTQTPPPAGIKSEEISDNLSVIEGRPNMPTPSTGGDQHGATGSSKTSSGGLQDRPERSSAATGQKRN